MAFTNWLQSLYCRPRKARASKQARRGPLARKLWLEALENRLAPSNVPPAGITSWWTGDGNADDVIGGHSGVLVGGATYGPGLVDQAFVLNGSSAFVNVPDNPALNVGTGNFTVELWVNFNTTTGEQVLAEKYVETFSNSETGWTLTKLGNNVLRLAATDGVDPAINIDSNVLTIPTNTWIEFAVERSGSTITTFMNGQAIASGTCTYNLNSTASLKLGHRGNPTDTPGSNDTNNHYLNGDIDEVQFYNGTALTSAQILGIYNDGSAGESTPMVVSRANPAADSYVSTPPTDFAVHFSEAPAAVPVGAFTVNGISANFVTQTGPNDATFHYNVSPVTTQGLQTMAMAAGSVTAADTTLPASYQPLAAWSKTFQYGAVLQVSSTRPAANGFITLPNPTLQVTFNKNYDPSTVSTGNLTLSQGTVTGFTLTSPTTVTYSLGGLNEGSLTVTIPAGALNDSFGYPMPTAYTGYYGVDIGTVPFPTPLAPVTSNNASSQVFQGSVAGLFNSEVPPFVYAGSGGLNGPVGAVFGPDGDLYVASMGNNSVLRYNPTTGAFLGTFVSSGSGGLNGPTGLFFGADGKLYVVSQGSNSVLRYDGTTGAFVDAFVTSGSGGLSQAQRAAFGPDGNLYISSGNTDSILRYNGSTGAFINAFVTSGNGGLSSPTGFVFGPGGKLYVASTNNNSVLCYDTATGAFLSTIVASGVGGLTHPTDLTFGTDGNLYVNSWGNDRVLRYSNATGAFIDAYVPPQAAGLTEPNAVLFDANGLLYVASYNGNAVYRYDGTSGGPGDVDNYTINLNSGQTLALSVTSAITATVSLSYAASPAPAGAGGVYPITNTGTYTISVQAANGLATGPYTIQATVTASVGATHFTVSSPATTTAGKPLAFVITALNSAGNVATSYSGTVQITSTDGQAVLSAINATLSSGTGIFAAVLDTAGNQTITASDTVNASIAGTSSPIAVSAGAATHFDVSAPASAVAGNPLTFTVTALDAFANPAPTYNGTVRFSSSDKSATLPGNTTLTGGVGTFTATLATPGGQTITASDVVSSSITGGSNSIVIHGLAVTSLTHDSSSFTATFNEAFVASDINLYDLPVTGGPLGPADVTLTSTTAGPASSPVSYHGSLILNDPVHPTAFTFVKTSDFTGQTFNPATGALAPGVYTVTLRSAGNGFHDALGNLLEDAAGVPGGSAADNFSFVTTFVVNASPVAIIGIPSFARGPGNNVILPNNAAPAANQGIPINIGNITSSQGVTSGAFNLVYNPQLLTITGGVGFAGNGVTMTTTVNSPGTAIVSFTANAALPSSSATAGTRLGVLLANVPDGASVLYADKAEITFTSASLNGGAIPIAGDDAVQVAAYLGDASGDGQLSAGDSALIAAVDTSSPGGGALPGFTAYRLADPVIIADLSGSGNITAADVSMLNSYLAGTPRPQLPPPNPHNLTITHTGPDPMLSLPETLAAAAGSTVVVPVKIDTARPAGSTGMTEAVLALEYDPKVFSVSASDVRLGSLVSAGSGWQLQTVVNPQTGEIGIDLFSSAPVLTTAGGSLVTIDLHVRATAPVGSMDLTIVNEVDPVGQRSFQTTVSDAEGALVLHTATTPAGGEPGATGLVNMGIGQETVGSMGEAFVPPTTLHSQSPPPASAAVEPGFADLEQQATEKSPLALLPTGNGTLPTAIGQPDASLVAELNAQGWIGASQQGSLPLLGLAQYDWVPAEMAAHLGQLTKPGNRLPIKDLWDGTGPEPDDLTSVAKLFAPS